MTNVLFAPTHLDALFVAKDRQVVSARADFRNLPYAEGGYDRNSNSPPVSDSMLHEEFNNCNFTLKTGLHLHWSLPDALTHGIHIKKNNRIEHYCVPNRWLISRKGLGEEKQWLVESDYIHRGDTPEFNRYGSISYPVAGAWQKGERPFVYLGRQLRLDGLDLNSWPDSGD